LRIMRTMVAAGAVAAAAIALVVAPAMADPVNSHYKSVTPHAYDIVGVGSNTTQYLVDQLGVNYNAAQAKKKVADSPSNPYLYSWDASNPKNPNSTAIQNIKVKPGCKAEARPTSSGQGITALGTFGNTKYTYKHKKYTVACVNFARASRGYKSGDPLPTKGGAEFVIFGEDAVTYATPAGGYAPNNLTPSQLAEIFSCNVPATGSFAKNTWGALGVTTNTTVENSQIDPIYPESSSGTLSFWIGALGLGAEGTSEPTCSSAAAAGVTAPGENEGTSADFYNNNTIADGVNPNVVYLYSVGNYISQKDHSKVCGGSRKGSENHFGCNQTGILDLRSVSDVSPTSGSGSKTVINPAFYDLSAVAGTFGRYLYNVVPYASNTKNHIPSNLQRFFNPSSGPYAKKVKGYFCSKAAQAVIADYGFRSAGAACGAVAG
jgi:ABC-type phosphate transport system substrate-binding protein